MEDSTQGIGRMASDMGKAAGVIPTVTNLKVSAMLNSAIVHKLKPSDTRASLSIHQGSFRNDQKDGPGKYVWANGEEYDGEWKDGKRHGSAKWKYPDGDAYEGEYVNGFRHGHGRFKCANGDCYVGSFVKGKENGAGKVVCANGVVYEGEFKGGKRHGKATWLHPNGDRFEGECGYSNCEVFFLLLRNWYPLCLGYFVNDKREGHGKYVWSNGEVYEGGWKNGKHHGKGKYRQANGEVYEVEYRNGIAL